MVTLTQLTTIALQLTHVARLSLMVSENEV
jgi:hypothetical protein